MKLAVVCPTINVPKALALYRQAIASTDLPQVRFFVVLSPKAPTDAVAFIAGHLGDCLTIVNEAKAKDWRCYEHIGDSIQARNIGFLEALKWGADLVLSIDDDNYPLRGLGQVMVDVFDSFITLPDGVLEHRLSVRSAERDRWFNPGALAEYRYLQRGIPDSVLVMNTDLEVEPCLHTSVGVAQGLVLGEPDIWAHDRDVRGKVSPSVTHYHELLREGVVFQPRPGEWTMFNSQITAIKRALVPAFMMVPGVGRVDDCLASLITQRVMRETGHVVHFGPPFVYQQRNAHDNERDIKDERWGYENMPRIAAALDTYSIAYSSNVADMATQLWKHLNQDCFISTKTYNAMVSILGDVGAVLS